jgi:hypothetical protein
VNAVTIKVRVTREGGNGISFALDREGHGDDLVEAHVDFVQASLIGSVRGLLALRGKPDDGEDWKQPKE